MMRSVFIVSALFVAACGQDKIEVDKSAVVADYQHTALGAAVEKFVAAQRTPQAYAELAQTVLKLRPGMDRAVAEEAELKLIVLALEPVQAVQGQPMGKQVGALGLTVWPTLLAPPIEADALLFTRDPKAAEIPPKPGEDTAQYFERLCGHPLSANCKRVVPELQGHVIAALAIQRATERARNAVGDCLMCSSDPGWHQAVVGWEELDRGANEWINDVVRRAEPDNWPIAGAAAEDDPSLPEAELSPRGDILIGGHSYGPNQQRIDVLRELRVGSDVIAMHLHPDTTLAQARGVLIDAKKAGIARVAVIAREPVYPWRRKAYWIAEGSGLRANLRPTDSVQLLLHSVDEVAGPGTVARVD
ncbi:MAG: hypothetical protein JWO36_4112 [Myxococcales bacterium]|nr:hypothetical protein [Myxococcales bacterium]